MFQQNHDRGWEHNEFDPQERRSSRRGKGIRLIKLPQMDRWKQCRTRRYYQAKFGGLLRVWKITPSREFEESQRLTNSEIVHIIRKQNTEHLGS
jgi:hypothetical protein